MARTKQTARLSRLPTHGEASQAVHEHNEQLRRAAREQQAQQSVRALLASQRREREARLHAQVTSVVAGGTEQQLAALERAVALLADRVATVESDSSDDEPLAKRAVRHASHAAAPHLRAT